MPDLAYRWLEEIRRKRILWTHSGNPAQPHLVLPTGEHTDSWFEPSRAAQDPTLLHLESSALIESLQAAGLKEMEFSRILGVGRGAAALAHTAAYILSSTENKACFSSFTDEPFGPNDRRMRMPPVQIEEGERVLLLLESFEPSIARFALEIVGRAGAQSVDVMGALVNFSGMRQIGRYRVQSLIDHQQIRWGSRDVCRLCRIGSLAFPLNEFFRSIPC